MAEIPKEILVRVTTREELEELMAFLDSLGLYWYSGKSCLDMIDLIWWWAQDEGYTEQIGITISNDLLNDPQQLNPTDMGYCYVDWYHEHGYRYAPEWDACPVKEFITRIQDIYGMEPESGFQFGDLSALL